jgi:hypothetical protein
MLVACRLAGLSALEGHYADLNALAQFGPTQGSSGHSGQWRICVQSNERRSGLKRPSVRAGMSGNGLNFPCSTSPLTKADEGSAILISTIRTQLTPSSAERARKERRHPKASTSGRVSCP